MPAPRNYVRGYSFAGYQATNPNRPLPGPSLDNELEEIEQSLTEAISGLNDIRRADGQLRNGIVGRDALAPDLSTGVRPATLWQAGIQYQVQDTVSYLTSFYRCTIGHLSTDFLTDLTATRWELYAEIGTLATDAQIARNEAVAAAAAAVPAAAAATAGSNNVTALYDLFDDRYLGEKTSLPTLDNDGNALVNGALVSLTGQTPTTLNGMYVRRGGVWQPAVAGFQGILLGYRYVATGGQTVFTGADANGLSLAYTLGALIVTVNGVTQTPNTYTATNGTSIVLGTPLTASDIVVIYSFGSFAVADTWTKAEADARYPRISVLGTNYDVQVNHGLDGTTGDRAKIVAALAAAPIGSTVHFPPVSSPIDATITMDRQLNLKWHGTTWRGVFGANTASSLLVINVPNANTVSGDLRRLTIDGLRWFWISGGNHGIDLQKGAGSAAGSLICTFQNLLGQSGANINGYAFRITDPDAHWHEIKTSYFEGRCIGHYGADGIRITKCQFVGTVGIDFNLVAGAFVTTVEGCTGAMTELAWRIYRGSNIRFVHNSWEQAGPNTGIYNVQALIQPNFAPVDTIHGVKISDNFGGGADVGACVRMEAGGAAVYDTTFEDCVFHPGSSGLDVQIINSGVHNTRFGAGNIFRGTRAGGDVTWRLSVSDNGTGTLGVWKTLSSQLTVSNGWSVVAGSRVMVCPYTFDVKFDGVLTPGTLTAGTVIGTLAAGLRPHRAILIPVVPNSGTAVLSVFVNTNGQITLNTNFAGTVLDLNPIRWPAIARTAYVPGE